MIAPMPSAEPVSSSGSYEQARSSPPEYTFAGAFPEVPTHFPVVPSRVTETPTEVAPQPAPVVVSLPPINPVQLPARRTSEAKIVEEIEERKSSPPSATRNTQPSPSHVSRNSSPMVAPAADLSVLYSRETKAAEEEPIHVIHAYPVMPEDQPYNFNRESSPNNPAAAVVDAKPFRESSHARDRTQEETKDYQHAHPSFSQSLRNAVHEIGDTLNELFDDPASSSAANRRTEGSGNDGNNNIARRTLMPYRVTMNAVGRYDVYVSMHQPQLNGSWSSPQGNRPREQLITTYSTEVEATLAAIAHAPPRWDGPNERTSCAVCNKGFSLLRRVHHCRNCGHNVCSSCSNKSWPATMIPPTYHNAEKKVRVCNGCQFLMESFRDALKLGDYDLARRTYESGNVNLHCPNDLERGEYPVHFAAQGGNLVIMRWLIEEQMCALRDPLLPLCTMDKLSVLGVAAMYGQPQIMHYLMHQHGCKVTEITNISVLQRALHLVVSAPGEPPQVKLGKQAFFRRNSARVGSMRASPIGNMDFSSSTLAEN